MGRVKQPEQATPSGLAHNGHLGISVHHPGDAGGRVVGAMVLGALIAHLLRCESPGVTCDLLHDAAHGAMRLPAAQFINQFNEMAELLI